MASATLRSPPVTTGAPPLGDLKLVNEAHAQWRRCFGSAELPQFNTVPQWTEWIVEQRRLARDEADTLLHAGKLAACALAPISAEPDATAGNTPSPQPADCAPSDRPRAEAPAPLVVAGADAATTRQGRGCRDTVEAGAPVPAERFAACGWSVRCGRGSR